MNRRQLLFGAAAILTATPAPLPAEFADDFERANTDPGTLGNGWSDTGDLTARIEAGAYVSDGNEYAFRDLGWSPSGMAMTVSWPLGAVATATLISSPRDSLLEHMVHFFLNREGWAFQIREDGGEFVGIASGALDIADDGTPHMFSWELFDGGVAVDLPMGGYEAIFDSRVAGLVGRWCTWQNANEPGSPSMRVESVMAWSR